jgi:hypothetical protein
MDSRHWHGTWRGAVALGVVVGLSGAGGAFAAGPDTAKAVVGDNAAPLIAAVKAGDRAAVTRLVKQPGAVNLPEGD